MIRILFSISFTLISYFACSQYVLVWSDEFTSPTLDATKWVHENGGHGWGNNESQMYTSNPTNLSIANGELTITALEEQIGNNPYTSAKIITKGLMETQYGKIEARIKCPMGQGLWPAFWMLGSNIDMVSWPMCGEIDVMEHVNTENIIHGTMHWDNSGHAYYGGSTIADPSQFHVYSIIWDSLKIQWLMDGNIYHAANIANGINGTSEFHESFYLILNLAVGGNWPGYPNSSTVFPAELVVDYVRVYKDQSEVSVAETSLDYVSLSPNPAINEITINNLVQTNHLRIISLDGKVLMEKSLSAPTTSIDVSPFRTGIYFAEIENNQGENKRIQFIIE